MSKYCTNCGIKKTLKNTGIDNDAPDGLCYVCKKCRSLIAAAKNSPNLCQTPSCSGMATPKKKFCRKCLLSKKAEKALLRLAKFNATHCPCCGQRIKSEDITLIHRGNR